MYGQAVLVRRESRNRKLASRLDEVFRDGIASRIEAERAALSAAATRRTENNPTEITHELFQMNG